MSEDRFPALKRAYDEHWTNQGREHRAAQVADLAAVNPHVRNVIAAYENWREIVDDVEDLAHTITEGSGVQGRALDNTALASVTHGLMRECNALLDAARYSARDDAS